MTDCCPTCGRPRQARFHTPFREKLIRLADGTRTDKELARLTGSTPGSVRVALTSLRQQGIPVKATRPGSREGGMPLAEYDLMTALREAGFTWGEIAKLRQHDEVSVRNRYARASKKYGLPMPNVPRKKKRDRGRDYVRMRELREDAQLPWRMVAKVVGMTEQAAGRYYRELKKVYDV